MAEARARDMSEDTPIMEFPRLKLEQDNSGAHCKTCAFWFKQPGNPGADLRAPVIGLCKRYPPVSFVVGIIQTAQGNLPQMATSVPATREEDFCGEYEPKV